MSTELSPLATVQQKIQDRIQAEFVSLIPEEMWERMIKGAVHDFITDKPNKYNHSQPDEPSPMKKMITDELRRLVQEQVNIELGKIQPQFGGMGQLVATEAMKTIVTEHFAELVGGIQRQMVEMTVMNAVQSIRNSMMR